MKRWANLILLLVFLCLVPAGIFCYFTRPSMGYPTTMAGLLAGAVALVGLLLIPLVARANRRSQEGDESLPAKTDWGVIIVFLTIMAVLVVYFMIAER